MKLQMMLELDCDFRFIGLVNTAYQWLSAHQRRLVAQARRLGLIKSNARVLYFRRDECVACRVQGHYLSQLDNDGGAIIETVDVDRRPELAQQYNVLSLPTTILLDAHGQARYINLGLAPKYKLAQQLNNMQQGVAALG